MICLPSGPLRLEPSEDQGLRALALGSSPTDTPGLGRPRKENGPPCEWASLIGNKASQTVGSISLQPRQFYGGLMNTARPMLGHRMALTSGGLPPNAETVRTILCEPTFAPPVFTCISRGFKQLTGGT